MKTKKKLLIALLSVSVMVAGAAGFAACGSVEPEKGEKGETGAAGKSAYELYYEAESAAGRTPKTEAEWLMSLIGASGQDGKSAYELYAEAEKAAGRDPMSQAEWLLSLVGNDGQSGKGVKSIELTEDKTGLLITYTDNTTETIELPAEVTHVHTYDDNYTVVLEPTTTYNGLAYVTCLSSTCDHKELVVLPKLSVPKEGDGSYMNPFVLGDGLKVGDSVTYQLTVGGKENYGWFYWNSNISLVGDESGEESVYYEVTINSDEVSYNQNYTPVQQFFVVVSDECLDLGLDVDAADYESAGEFTFNVTVERVAPPPAGSINNPIAVTPGEKVEVEAEPDADVYFLLDLSSKNDSSNYAAGFDGTNMKLYWLGADINGDREDELVDGEAKSMGYYGTYYYKASAKDGKIAFTLTVTYLPGEQQNPIEVELDETYTTKYGNWYSFTAEETGKFTVSGTGSPYYYFYAGEEAVDENMSTVVNSSKFVFEAEEGKTYYFKTQGSFDLVVSEYDAEKDAGVSAAVPKQVEAGNIVLTSTSETYFVYTAEKAGLFYVAGTNAEFSVFNNADYKSYGGDNARLFYQVNDELCVEVEEGDVLYFTAKAKTINTTTTSGTLVVGVNDEEELSAVAYTFVLVDDAGEALSAGVEVSANGVSGTTDEDGKVTLNLVPGKYDVSVNFGDVTGYAYLTTVTTKMVLAANETTVTVAKNQTYKVTVMHKGDAVEGLTVKLGNYEAVTDENGVATFSVPDGTYSVSIVNEDDAEDPYVLSNSLTLYGSQYGANREGSVSVLLDSETIKLESISVSTTTATVLEADKDSGYKFTSSNNYDYNFKVENGHIDSLKVGGQTIIVNGFNPSGSNTDYTPMFYGASSVEIIIVPDEGETATLTITAVPW